MKKNTVQEYTWPDLMQDQVVPVSVIERTGKTARIKALCGTAFFIGNNGYALTAKHILPEENTTSLAISILIHDKTKQQTKRHHVIIEDMDCHPTADIAIIKTDITTWHSIFQLNIKKQCPNTRYQLTGYPLAAAKDPTKPPENRLNPAIGYNIGYIRTYLADTNKQDMPNTVFYELSKAGGLGIPGSPVFRKTGSTFEVIGIYVGEKKTKEENSAVMSEPAATPYGIALSASSFYNWVPKCLGHTIMQEMNG